MHYCVNRRGFGHGDSNREPPTWPERRDATRVPPPARMFHATMRTSEASRGTKGWPRRLSLEVNGPTR
jgi:hypothetical protein